MRLAHSGSCCGSVLILLGLFSSRAMVGETVAIRPPEEQALSRAVAWVGDIGALISQAYFASRWPEARQKVPVLEKAAPLSLTDRELERALCLYRAEVLAMKTDTDAYMKLKEQMVEEDFFGPELLWVERMCVKRPTIQERIAFWNVQGQYVPLSMMGMVRDDRNAPAGAVDPPLPDVPQLQGLSKRLAEIAAIYARSGHLREAVNSLIESVYCQPGITNPAFADSWLQVAKWEEEMGERRLAIRAYFSAVHNDKAKAAEVTAALRRILSKDTVPEKRVEVTSPKLALEDALRIAELYRQSNLHPMALGVLRAYERAPDSPEAAVWGRIESEWLKIVSHHRELRGPKCVLLDQRVDDVKDWSTVSVRRPSDLFWKPQAAAATRPAGGN